MLKINPFYLLISFYLIVNLIFALIGFNNNNVEIELSLFYLKSNSFIIAYFFQLFSCFFIIIAYLIFKNFNKSKRIDLIGRKGAFLLFLLQFCFLLYNAHYETNIAGGSIKASNMMLNTFFVLLPVDLFYIIFSPYLKSNKWFVLNTFLYVISNTLRGWMGAILLAFFVFLCRKERVEVTIKSLLNYSIFIAIVFLMLPYLFLLKWAMRSSDSVLSVLEVVNKDSYLDLLGEGLYYVFNRFQHNYHVALIWENSEILVSAYQAGRILPYWGEGVIQTIFIKLLSLGEIKTLGQAMVSSLFYSQGAWNSNPGLSGWLIVTQEYFIFYIFYVFIVLFFGFYISKKFYDNKIFMILSVFSIFYLFHGWIGSYVTMITYLLFFAMIKRIRF